MRDEKLISKCQALVDDETILGAFLCFVGPRLGTEIVGMPIVLAIAFASDSYVLGAIAFALWFMWLASRRDFRAVAITSQSMLLLHCPSWRSRSPSQLLSRQPRAGSIRTVDESEGDTKIVVANQTYWLPLPSLDEARTLAALVATR